MLILAMASIWKEYKGNTTIHMNEREGFNMSYIKERVSYLKGLAEGLKVSESTSEGKLITAMLDVLEDISDELDLITAEQEDMSDILADMGDYLDEEDFDEDDEDEMDYFEIECEKCGHKLCIDEDMLDSEEDIKCPSCGEIIEIEFDCTCDDDDCDCHH